MKISFVGNNQYPILYRSGLVCKKVSWLEQDKDYSVVVFGCMHGPAVFQTLTMGVEIFEGCVVEDHPECEERRVVGKRSINMEKRDLFSLVRAMRLVLSFPVLTDKSLSDACYTSRLKIDPMDKNRLDRVWEQIGESNYRKIMTSMPPKLEKCVSVLTEQGVRIEPQYYKDEIFAGRLTLETGLEQVMEKWSVNKTNPLLIFFQEAQEHFIRSNTAPKSSLASALEYYLSELLALEDYKTLEGDLIFILAIILSKFSTTVYRTTFGGPGEPGLRLQNYIQYVDLTLAYMRSLPANIRYILSKQPYALRKRDYRDNLLPWLERVAFDDRINLVRF